MTAAASVLRVVPGGVLSGRVTVPGDKSVTHRALIGAALADGVSTITGALDAGDTRATARALEALGAGLDWSDERIRVVGTGGELRSPEAPLDLGNSGTGLRLLAGALCGRGIAATLTGDASLRRRPMERIARPLQAMGAAIEAAGGRPPLRLHPVNTLHGMRYRLPVASAQVKSAVLLAGLAAAGSTVVEDPYGTRDHTERLLPVFGARVTTGNGRIELAPGPLSPADVAVPGDFSSAAFLVAGALLAPGSRLTVADVGVNPTRTGMLGVLERMGAVVRMENRRFTGGEPVADLRVEASRLTGTRVDAAEIPALIDELPVLMVLAAAADGATVIEGAGELRHKESDRIETMRAALAALDVHMDVAGDRITIPGGGIRRGGRAAAGGDHRVAMALAVAGLAAPAPVSVTGSEWIATSFPRFAQLLSGAGVRVEPAA